MKKCLRHRWGTIQISDTHKTDKCVICNKTKLVKISYWK